MNPQRKSRPIAVIYPSDRRTLCRNKEAYDEQTKFEHSVYMVGNRHCDCVRVFMLAGCSTARHADVKDAVNSALTSNNLGVVSVSQDREKGVITLTGDVESQDKKELAESVAKQAAPGYAIANQIGVRPPGAESQAKAVASSLDSGIEDNYKAALQAHKNLDAQSISYSATNGSLVLKGSVKTQAQRNEANKLARAVPNVKEVVNEIEVKPDKHSTSH